MASLVVSEIPAECNTSELRDYFEQEAGSVDSLSYLLHPLDGDPRQAIVAFRDSTAATYVAKCTHEIAGAPILVTLRPREMFTRCTVQVDSLVLVTCTPHIDQCLKAIERDLGVKVERSSGNVILIGALAQIESANVRLQKLWQHQVMRQERELDMINRESHDQIVRGHESKRQQADDHDPWGHASTRYQTDDQNIRGHSGTRLPSDDHKSRGIASTRLRLGDLSLREAGFLGETISSDSDTGGHRMRVRHSAEGLEYGRLREASGSHGSRTSQRDTEPVLRDVSPGPLQSQAPFTASVSGRRNMEEILIQAIGGTAFNSDDRLTGQRHQHDTMVLGRTPEVAWTTPGSQDYLAGSCTGEISLKPVPRLVTEAAVRTKGQDAGSGSRFNVDDHLGVGNSYHGSGDDFHRPSDNYENLRKHTNSLPWHDRSSEKHATVPFKSVLIDRDVAGFVQKVHARNVLAIESDLHVTFQFHEAGDEIRVVISLPRPFDMLLQNLDMAHKRLFDDIVKTVAKERFCYCVDDITPPQVDELVSGVLCQFNHLVLHVVQPGELLLVGSHTEVSQAMDMIKANIYVECQYPAEGATQRRSEEESFDRQSRNGTASVSGSKRATRSRINSNGYSTSNSNDRLDGVTDDSVTEPSSWKTRKVGVSSQHSFRTGEHSKIPTKLWNTSGDAKKQSEGPSGVSRKPSNDTATGGNQFQFSMGDDLNVVISDGDITAERVDVIVSAANGHLANYSGVAGAISRAAGRQYERDCIDYVTKHGPLSVTAVVPMAVSGPLSCQYVLHAVGPVWNLYVDKNRCSADLRRTFYNCLCAADDLGATSIALPAISTGIFHVPTDICAQCLLVALQQFARERTSDRSLLTVRIVNLNSEVTEMFAIILEQLLSVDGRTINRVDSTAPDGANGLVGRSDQHWNVGDRIVPSSSDSSPGGDASKSVMRRSLNSRVSAAKSCPIKSQGFRADDKVEVAQQRASQNRPLSADRPRGRDSSRRRCTSLDRRRGCERPCDEPWSWCRSLRDNNSHAMRPRANEQISKTLRQTLSRNKSSSASVPVRPSKPPKKKALPPDSPSTSESEVEKLEVEKPEVEKCSICLDAMVLPKTLPKCGHRYCSCCIDAHFRHGKPICPICGAIYGVLKGDQPEGGIMSWQVDHSLRLPGFIDSVGAIVIKYAFPDGTQQDYHPSPGKAYSGIERQAFLPNNLDGREVVTLLKKAFDAGLVFTISDSRTTGHKDVITWNDIHHKTSIHGGSIGFGYPDPTYIQRVKEELAKKGITSQEEVKKPLRSILSHR